jgi:hypothetical protein
MKDQTKRKRGKKLKTCKKNKGRKDMGEKLK